MDPKVIARLQNQEIRNSELLSDNQKQKEIIETESHNGRKVHFIFVSN